MYNYVYRQFGNYNPGGIEINLGYYALAECIIKETFPSVALSRWCDLQFDPKKERHYKGKVILDIKKLKQIFKERFLTYKFLSEITGKSTTFYIRMFNGEHRYYPAEVVYALEEGLGLPSGSLIKESTQ